MPVGREAALAAMVSKNAKLGLVMYEVRRTANEVEKIIADTLSETT